MVQAVCWQRLRNHAEAQEAAQEVFIKALQKLGQLKEPAAFAGWLRAIAVRQSINRSVRRPPAVAVEPHTLEGVGGARRGAARARCWPASGSTSSTRASTGWRRSTAARSWRSTSRASR